MCACRLEFSPSHPTPQAADPLQVIEEYYIPYLSDMDLRSDENTSDTEDLYTQLAQKERDLILAAELGKALLEKNEELTKKHESYVEENNQKLEVRYMFGFSIIRAFKAFLSSMFQTPLLHHPSVKSQNPISCLASYLEPQPLCLADFHHCPCPANSPESIFFV